MLAIAVIVIVTTVAISVREGIYPPRAFMIVLLMLGGNNTMFELASRRADTQVLVAVVTFVRILILVLAAATIMDFILRQRLPAWPQNSMTWRSASPSASRSRARLMSSSEMRCETSLSVGKRPSRCISMKRGTSREVTHDPR